MENSKNFLIILPGGIGNAVLFIPSLIILNKNYPFANFDFLITKNCLPDVFINIPFVRNVFIIPSNFIKIIFLLIKLFFNRYDYCIATMGINKKKAYLISRFIFAKFFLCEKNNNLSNTHEVIRNFLIIKSIIKEGTEKDLKLTYYLNNDDIQFADNFYENVIKEEFIGIAPGSGNFLKEKRWHIDNFLILANLIVTNLNIKVVFFGSKQEEYLLADKKNNNEKILNCIGKLKLNQTAALIRKAKLFIANDCGLMHIANALDIPVIAIFGPTIINKNRPFNPASIVISKNYDCQPCYKFNQEIKCNELKCLNDIKPEEVFLAVKKFLKIY
ncbi:MAG TPA: glycosyltransferase family 9 protein [bacterium]|nr:glycosyltransferase family 9 protein [bacterium]